MDGSLHFGKAFLDLVGNANHVDLDTSAGRAGDKGDAPVAQLRRAQDFVGHRNLFFGFRAQAHTHGIADASASNRPRPTEDLTAPVTSVPASVMPRWRG